VFFFRLMRKYHEVVCRRCGNPIFVGEKVISVVNTRSLKLYHFDCWEGLFIDI